MSEKHLIKIEKLIALYRGGSTEAERSNAYDKIERLCAKHSITIESVLTTEEPRKRRTFRFWKPEDKRLLMQLLGKLTKARQYYSGARGRKIIVVELTQAEFINMTEWYVFYRKAYHAELKSLHENFFQAFISRNDLFSVRDEDDDREPTPPNPDLDIDLIHKLAGLNDPASPMVKLESPKLKANNE